MLPTKDQVLATMRHVYTALGTAGLVAVAMGKLDQAQLDEIMSAVKTIGGSASDIVMAIGGLVAAWNAYRASRSASPTQQIKRVEENIPGVVVTPTTTAGAELLKEATGVVRSAAPHA